MAVARVTEKIDQRESLPVPAEMLAGFASGLAASVPMALVMLALLKLLPKNEQYALPPEEITTKTAARAGADEAVRPKSTRRAATWLAHLGYGAATGSLYPLLTGWMRIPVVLRGILFGSLIWAGSYMGWLPAVNLLPPATDLPARRNLLMITSHWVWGALIGILVDQMEKRSK